MAMKNWLALIPLFGDVLKVARDGVASGLGIEDLATRQEAMERRLTGLESKVNALLWAVVAVGLVSVAALVLMIVNWC